MPCLQERFCTTIQALTAYKSCKTDVGEQDWQRRKEILALHPRKVCIFSKVKECWQSYTDRYTGKKIMTTQLLVNLALPNKHNKVVRIMMLATNCRIERIRCHQVKQSIQRQNPEGNWLFYFAFVRSMNFLMLKPTRERNLKTDKEEEENTDL